jgi:hypothetical protein
MKIYNNTSLNSSSNEKYFGQNFVAKIQTQILSSKHILNLGLLWDNAKKMIQPNRLSFTIVYGAGKLDLHAG